MGGGPAPESPMSGSSSSSLSYRDTDDAVEVVRKSNKDIGSEPQRAAAGAAEEAAPSTSANSTSAGQREQTVQDPLGGARETIAGLTLGEGQQSQHDGHAQLLYSKSKVYIHPTPYSRDNVSGFVAIVDVRPATSPSSPPPWGNYHLAWIPEHDLTQPERAQDHDAYVLVELGASADRLVSAPAPAQPTDSSSSKAMAHAWCVPIRHVYSIVVQPPTLSSWNGALTISVVYPPAVTTGSADAGALSDDELARSGESMTLPSLYFHDEEARSTVLDRDRRSEMMRGGGAAAGQALPPAWGGEALVSALRAYARLVRSGVEQRLLLVNPSRADRVAHACADEGDEDRCGLPDVPEQAKPGFKAPAPPSSSTGERDSILHRSLGQHDFPDDLATARAKSSRPDRDAAGMDNLTFSVLNSFSRVTRGARTAAQSAAHSVLSHPLARPILHQIPEPIASFASVPGELIPGPAAAERHDRWAQEAGVDSFDSSRLFLAKWARVVAEEGARARRVEVVSRGEGATVDESSGAFEVLSTRYNIGRPVSVREPSHPITLEEWRMWYSVKPHTFADESSAPVEDDGSGRLELDEGEVKRRIFVRGVAPDARGEVWPFLFRVYSWASTHKEREEIRRRNAELYERRKTSWQTNGKLKETDVWAEESHRINIDCRRTDRTHPLFASTEAAAADAAHPPSNAHVRSMEEILLTYVFGDVERGEAGSIATIASTEKSYVQGMSDLLSPLYVISDADASMAYACFVTMMSRMRGNFARDQQGMKANLSKLQELIVVMDSALYRHLDKTNSLNLFFCFRWLLCSFKREFSFDQTMQLWEALWTDHLGTHFHLFVALAIIEQHRDILIRYLQEFDEVLKYVNELAGTLDVQQVLADAEVLYYTFRKVLESNFRRRAEAQSRREAASEQTLSLRKRTSSSALRLKEQREQADDESEAAVDGKLWQLLD